MFRVSRAAASLCRATPVAREAWKKTSTGLVGLPVDPNARVNLAQKQNDILEKIKIIPEHTGYRKAVEAISKYRLKVLDSSLTDEQVEDEINCGQLEELIVQADDELGLIQFYYDERIWERREALDKIDQEMKGPRPNPWEW
ncbi:NADH dehydrogenase [Tribonema minus]|uniref:NADH dehydrogenase n=1 Tax=Tribonema minus TaxID=303371 RepID=A0A835Z296_9STRA|nr:NADH dehydrogenase [Tribonema minus]